MDTQDTQSIARIGWTRVSDGETPALWKDQNDYYIELNREVAYCIQRNKVRGDDLQIDKEWGLWCNWIKEAGLAHLSEISTYGEASSSYNIWGKETIIDILCIHYEHPHIDQKGRCAIPLSLTMGERHSYFPAGLRLCSLTRPVQVSKTL